MLGLIGSLLPPHEAIHDAGIALNNPRDLHRHILGGIVGDRCAEVAVLLHLHCQINGLQQLLRVDAGEDEAALVQRLRPLGGGADAHCRKRLAYRQVEARLLRQGAAVGHDAEGVHLQAVVIVKAQRLVGDDAPVQLESAFLQSLTAPGVAGVQHRQVVLRRHGVYCREQGSEILLRVDVFLPVGREQNVLAFFQTEPGVNVAGLDLGQILMQHLRHGAAHHKRALLRDACGVQITGLFAYENDLYYAVNGKTKDGWREIETSDGSSQYYYFDPTTLKAVDGVQTIRTMITENGKQYPKDLNYTFEDHVLVRGDWIAVSTGRRY